MFCVSTLARSSNIPIDVSLLAISASSVRSNKQTFVESNWLQPQQSHQNDQCFLKAKDTDEQPMKENLIPATDSAADYNTSILPFAIVRVVTIAAWFRILMLIL
jgi:hypothetical protein